MIKFCKYSWVEFELESNGNGLIGHIFNREVFEGPDRIVDVEAII